MSVNWELILSVLSILGVQNGASGLRFCFREYGDIEKEWEKGGKDPFVFMRRRVKLLLIPVGSVSLFMLYFVDQELFDFVVKMMSLIFFVVPFHPWMTRF